MDKRNRKEAKWGVLAYAAYLIFSRFTQLPDFGEGALCGFAIVMLLISVLPEPAYAKLKSFKQKLKYK